MNPLRLAAVSIMLLTTSAFTAAAAATPATTQSSPKANAASRSLLITGTGNLSDADTITIGEHVQKVGRAKLGPAYATIDPYPWYRVSRVINEPDLDIVVDFTQLNIPADPTAPVIIPPVAAEIADETVEFVRQYLNERADRESAEAMQRVTRSVEQATAAAANADNKAKSLRQNLRDQSGRADVSPATLTAALSAMDQQLQQFQIELLSKDSRRKAVEEELAKVAERVEKSVKQDAIAAELQKVVAAREERVARIKQMAGAGQASTTEVSESIAQAAEARAKMLQQQRDSAAAVGGNILEKFNAELISLSIDSRELQAKVKYLEERLPGLRASVEMLDDYAHAAEAAQLASGMLRKAEAELSDTRRAIDERPTPKVMIRSSQNTLVE